MKPIGKKFISGVLLSNTRSAAFQRTRIYAKDIEQKEKDRFIKAFENKLVGLEPIYARGVSEAMHVKNIQSFASELSDDFPQVLHGGRLKK
ncbi:MAG: hypothetical protein GY697_25450 [Desulfobacterales bacterium]|nr:hypothetical protein [Desulfobacterales bacterium]